jgi:hypothetical protein
MKKVLLSLISLTILGFAAKAQSASTSESSKIDLTGRASDHLMFQIGTDTWTGAPDSVKLGGGTSRHFNVYFMYDKPFKTNQHFSVAYGAGIGTSNIFFDNHTNVDLKSGAATLPFKHIDSTANHFSKVKLAEIYLHAPLELRYYSDPKNPNKSWKAAAGVKVGILMKAYTKSKNLVDRYGSSVYGKTYVEKEINKRFLNATDISLTGRVGYGMLSLDAAYLVNGVLRDGYGPKMNRFSVGITISGL